MTRKNNQRKQQSILDKVILLTVKAVITFIICIIIQNKIIHISGYKIFILEDPGEEKYIQHTYVEKGYKIYPIQYEENDDITSWTESLKYWGYIKKD